MAIEYDKVSRDDVARFLAASMHEPRLSRAIIQVTGGTTPIFEAVTRLADESV